MTSPHQATLPLPRMLRFLTLIHASSALGGKRMAGGSLLGRLQRKVGANPCIGFCVQIRSKCMSGVVRLVYSPTGVRSSAPSAGLMGGPWRRSPVEQGFRTCVPKDLAGTGKASSSANLVCFCHVPLSPSSSLSYSVTSIMACLAQRVKLSDGSWEWRKGGTQKKDGFWSLVRRFVSRRAVKSSNHDMLRKMAFFYQWIYWRSNDPIGDAIRGRHEAPPHSDMVHAFGELRRDLRTRLGDAKLQEEDWFDKTVQVSETELADILPRKRVRAKQSPST